MVPWSLWGRGLDPPPRSAFRIIFLKRNWTNFPKYRKRPLRGRGVDPLSAKKGNFFLRLKKMLRMYWKDTHKSVFFFSGQHSTEHNKQIFIVFHEVLAERMELRRDGVVYGFLALILNQRNIFFLWLRGFYPPPLSGPTTKKKTCVSSIMKWKNMQIHFRHFEKKHMYVWVLKINVRIAS